MTDIPAPPCSECGRQCDYEVPWSGMDRVWYCTDCGTYTAENLHAGGPTRGGTDETDAEAQSDDGGGSQGLLTDYPGGGTVRPNSSRQTTLSDHC